LWSIGGGGWQKKKGKTKIQRCRNEGGILHEHCSREKSMSGEGERCGKKGSLGEVDLPARLSGRREKTKLVRIMGTTHGKGFAGYKSGEELLPPRAVKGVSKVGDEGGTREVGAKQRLLDEKVQMKKGKAGNPPEVVEETVRP